MGIRAGLLLWLLLVGYYGPAQPNKAGNDVVRFHRQIAGLPPMQRIKPTIEYGRQLLEQSRFTEARPLLQSALATARQGRLTHWTAQLCIQLGVLESIAGNHTLSIDYHLQALAILRATHAYNQQIQVCDDISSEYSTLRNEAKSREYAELVSQLANAYWTSELLVRVYSLQSVKASERGHQDSVLMVHRKCLTVLRAIRQWGNYYSFLDGYGVALGHAGRYREAEETFYRCLAYARRQGDLRREKYEYVHLPEPLLHQGRLDEAQQYANLALSWIKRDPERQDQHRVEVYGVLTRIAEAKGEYKQALAYERLHHQYLDQVQNADRSRQVAEVESRFQIAQKQGRIDQLAGDNRRQLDRIGWQAGGLFVLLGLAGWQYRLIRRVNAQLQATNRTVSQNNHQISEQAERLTVLMRELHHRVKNNLAIVSSLLRMQSKRLDDPRAMQAVQDGQRRVEAISLIHQQFYQTENLAEVSIKSYVTELTQGMLLGYGYDPETFDCRIEVANLRLNVEVAVPLGLILNEVLTNAFKYAYPGGAVGRHRPSLLVRLQAAPAGGLLVEVQDNGPGLPASLPASGGRSQSFGQRLIRELTGQLGGEMSLTTRRGTYFRLWIPTPV